MRLITGRQHEVLQTIRATILETGVPPTIRELGAKLGIGTTNGVMCHIRQLMKKGLVRQVNSGSRGYIPAADIPAADIPAADVTPADALHALLLALEGTSGAVATTLAEFNGTAYADAVRALRDCGKFTEDEAASRLRVVAEVAEE